MFSLDHSDNIKELMVTDKELNSHWLAKRKDTLGKQLERGLQIIRSPVQFLKTQQSR
jgi:hypothetical protein